MNFDDHVAFRSFSTAVRFKGRVALSSQTHGFLSVFRHQAKQRRYTLPKDIILYRAVCHYDAEELPDGGLDIRPASEDRIRPKAELVTDGRVNPKGIAYLYLASSIDTAISEVRPWLDEGISVAHFRTTREFSVVNLSKMQGQSSLSLLNRAGFAGGLLTLVTLPWLQFPALRSSWPRLLWAGCSRSARGGGGC